MEGDYRGLYHGGASLKIEIHRIRTTAIMLLWGWVFFFFPSRCFLLCDTTSEIQVLCDSKGVCCSSVSSLVIMNCNLLAMPGPFPCSSMRFLLHDTPASNKAKLQPKCVKLQKKVFACGSPSLLLVKYFKFSFFWPKPEMND